MIEFDRQLDGILGSAASSRTLLTRGDRSALEASFTELRDRAARRLGAPAFDSRFDRAAIDTWFPDARQFAAWPHADGLVFLVVERHDQPTLDALLIGYATEEEISLRRGYRGHVATPPPDVQAPLEAPEPGLPSWVRHAYRRPQGLGPLSSRPRDRAVRWLTFLGVVVGLIAVFGFLIAARSSG